MNEADLLHQLASADASAIEAAICEYLTHEVWQGTCESGNCESCECNGSTC